MFSVTEMPITLDDFELERCIDETHSEISESAETKAWIPFPLPQKFPTRSRKAQHEVTQCTNRRLAAKYMANSRRAIGTMIDLEESARWSCSDEDIRNSAGAAAVLMIMYDRG
jgi:hypothetical protein